MSTNLGTVLKTNYIHFVPVVLKLKPQHTIFLCCRFYKSKRALIMNDLENTPISFSAGSDNNLISLLHMTMVNWWHKESKNINANYQIHWRSVKTWWATFLIICQRFMLTVSFFAGGLVLLFQTASFTRYFILGFFFDYNFNFYVSLFRSSISGRELFCFLRFIFCCVYKLFI